MVAQGQRHLVVNSSLALLYRGRPKSRRPTREATRESPRFFFEAFARIDLKGMVVDVTIYSSRGLVEDPAE